MRKGLVILFCLSALMAFYGCSVSQATLDSAEKRIDALHTKGVPDSSLSLAKVYLYQAKDAKQRSNHGLARSSADTMLVLIAKAEDQYAKDMERLKPYVSSLQDKFRQFRGQITGLQLARLDSLRTIVDGFVAKNWMLEAEAEANKLDTLLPRLKFDEDRAKELRPRILGTWTCTNVSKSATDKTVNAVEKKVFTFGADGKASLVESKKGKSGSFLKEDWEFQSNGTYDLMGDTIFVFVKRFAALRQNFEEGHDKDGNGKITWEKKNQPTYDSTITDGSQNRYITFSDLTEDFKK